MRETFVIIGWLFAVFLILIASLSFMTINISGFFPFQKEAMTANRCQPRYVEVITFTDCKLSCLERFKTESYKTESGKCFCDVNKC